MEIEHDMKIDKKFNHSYNTIIYYIQIKYIFIIILFFHKVVFYFCF